MSNAVTLGGAFTAACALRHDLPFLADGKARLDGAEAARKCDRIATFLHARGLRPGGRVAFLSRPGVHHTLAWFAVVRLGGIVTNLHLLESPERQVQTIAWLEAGLVIHDTEFAGLAAELAAPGLQFISLDEAAAGGRDASAPPLDRGAAQDAVAIVLSSGSTGRPKGIVHTHASILASIAAGVALYDGIGPSDSVLVCIGTSFGGWCNVVLPFLGAGTRLVFQRRFEPDAFLRGLADEKITIAPLVPTMWRMVLAAQPERFDLSSVRLAFMSGEAASRTDVAALHRQVTRRVRAAYLSTEGACGCGVVVDEEQYLTGGGTPAGRPLENVEVRIVDPDGGTDALPAGETGEILLRGASLASGYWKDPQRTAERFCDGWWRSGDTGALTADERLIVAGRTDHVINSGGVKIQAEEIEAELMQHPQIRQAAVVGLPDAKWGQRATAFVVVSKADLDAQALAAWCQAQGRIAAMKFVKDIRVVERLPTGATGKLYRPALMETT